MTKAVVQTFKEAGHELFLFGSRSKILTKPAYLWFGFEPLESTLITPTTDWDYAGQDCDLLHTYLLDNNFVMKPDVSYRDVFTTHIFEKTLEDGSVIQVSLKHNLETFKEFWNWIPKYLYTDILWKRGYLKPAPEEITERINTLADMFFSLKQKYTLDKESLWE